MRAVCVKPAGRRVTWSPWLIQTVSAGLESGEEQAALLHLDLRPAVLPALGALDLAVEQVRHELHAVADAEHRNAELEERALGVRRAGVVDALRPAREDDADRRAAADLLGRHRERMHFAVDPVLAQAARDQLGELTPEIEDEDGLVGCHGQVYRIAVERSSVELADRGDRSSLFRVPSARPRA